MNNSINALEEEEEEKKRNEKAKMKLILQGPWRKNALSCMTG